jgi:DNA mismatch repair protein MutL
MTSSIQTLPTEVVHLIAAGEVIDSLAAVVRELVENALDAGATRIAIALWTDQWRIRVADNGSGMTLANLRQAATPHSTSKIRSSSDLWQIHSLGFRGEALHSLARLADLEIYSRSATTPEGWRVNYDAQGEPSSIEPVAIAPGTVVTITHLFGNALARRQGLPPLSQQLRAVQTTLYNLALCHPQVTWQIEQNDRPWFAIWSGSSAKQVLPQILREVQPSDLQELRLELAEESGKFDLEFEPFSGQFGLGKPGQEIHSHTLYLLLGLPDRCHRHRPDWVRIAVNNRMVRVPELEQVVFAAFRRTLPRDRHPVCFLHLRTPSDQIDWNRHPAKAEIYLHHVETWREQVKVAIEQAFHMSSARLPDAASSKRVGQLIKAAEAGGVYNLNRSVQPASPDSIDSIDPVGPLDLTALTQPSFLAPQPLIPLKAIAQVHQRYILVEHPTGMWLVEQHIAHERVLYEQLCDRWQLVPLDPPILLSQLSPLQVEQLQRLGLEIEQFGDRLWAVRTAPEPLSQREDCAEALLELSLGGDLESALVATACRTAIRNGTPLTPDEMQTLLDQWQQTRHPHTCPHGRPIYLSLAESSLSRFFRRHWVIGKSHGI